MASECAMRDGGGWWWERVAGKGQGRCQAVAAVSKPQKTYSYSAAENANVSICGVLGLPGVTFLFCNSSDSQFDSPCVHCFAASPMPGIINGITPTILFIAMGFTVKLYTTSQKERTRGQGLEHDPYPAVEEVKN